MTHEGTLAAQGLPGGYRLDVVTTNAISVARIRVDDGRIAASGHAVEVGGVFVFDRIVTEPAHQRRRPGHHGGARCQATSKQRAPGAGGNRRRAEIV